MGTSRRRRSVTAGWSLVVGLGAAGCNLGGGQPSANSQPAHPPVITDEFPNVPNGNGVASPARGAGNGVATNVDDNVSRVDRILREREQAQRAADDIHDLRQATRRPAEPAAPSANPTANASNTVAVAPAADPNVDPPVYDPASDAAAIAAMVNRNQPAQPDANAATKEPTGDFGDNPPARRAEGIMMSPTQTQLDGGVNGGPLTAPNISRQSSVDPMLALEQTYAGRVAHDPSNLSAQFEYQLLHLLSNQQSPQPADMAGLANDDQALLSAMCDALNNFRNVVRTQPNALERDKARPFVEMAERITSQSDLAISSPTLCEEVVAFGNYTPLNGQRLQANVAVPAVFYCEVDGFQPVLNEQQQYETKLTLELKLYSASRELQVWNLPPMNVNDVSRRRRRDFFISKLIEIPPQPADTYLLKAIVKDLQGNRLAEKTLQFTLAGPSGR